MWRLAKGIYFFIALLVAHLIVYKSTDYFNPDFSKGFLIGKEAFFHFYKYGLYTHMVAAPIAFILGIVQLLWVSSNYHQKIGFVYVFLVLFFAAPSGLFMSFFAIGGFVGFINFAVLSGLWWGYTFFAYRAIQKGKVKTHIRLIVGSFILANSAVLLRIFSFINNHFEWLPGPNGYVVVSILSWLPPILIYEIYVSMKKDKPSSDLLVR